MTLHTPVRFTRSHQHQCERRRNGSKMQKSIVETVAVKFSKVQKTSTLPSDTTRRVRRSIKEGITTSGELNPRRFFLLLSGLAFGGAIKISSKRIPDTSVLFKSRPYYSNPCCLFIKFAVKHHLPLFKIPFFFSSQRIRNPRVFSTFQLVKVKPAYSLLH